MNIDELEKIENLDLKTYLKKEFILSCPVLILFSFIYVLYYDLIIST